MGSKGDRAAKEPLAKKMYADDRSLVDIAGELDVSDTTLRRWKSEDKVPGEEIDGWDKARQQKRGNVQRLQDILDEQLTYLQGLQPSERTSQMFDGLSKIGALVERINKMDAEIRRQALAEAADAVKNIEKKVKKVLDPDTKRIIWEEIYGLV